MKLCFVAPKAYNVLSARKDIQHIGGAEVQQVLIARCLASRGYSVSFITLDYGQRDGEEIDGIRVYRAYDPKAGMAGLRFLHPRATSLWAAMSRADADIYYQRTSDPLTGIVAAFCNWRRRNFVFSVGHDGDCGRDLPFCPKRRERFLYVHGLKRARAVVAQTASQQRALRDNFNVHSVIIPNCKAPWPSDTPPNESDGRTLLWIGRFAPEKRLELLLEVAEHCPELTFNVIGDGPDNAYTRKLKHQAAGLGNVHLIGQVPHGQVVQHYRHTTALVCTSSSEGFPNTFLEAWSLRIPVVTSFDPDGIVTRHHLGLYAENRDAFIHSVQSMCSDAQLRDRLSRSAHEYYLSHHTPDIAVSAYHNLFQDLLARKGRTHMNNQRQIDHKENL